MSNYELTFLDTADAEGLIPVWALEQIFAEHGSDLDEYTQTTPEKDWFNGEVILDWLGY